MSILTLAILALPAAPDVRAHFQPTFIDGGCWVNSQRPWGAGDPDRFYRVAIFDESNGNVFNACADGCGDDGNAALSRRVLLLRSLTDVLELSSSSSSMPLRWRRSTEPDLRFFSL